MDRLNTPRPIHSYYAPLSTFLTFLVLLGLGASAQSVAEVQKLPLLHDPATPEAKQKLTTTEKQIAASVAKTVNARAEFKAFLTKNRAEPINPSDVLMSFVAPFRSATPERLTLFPVFAGDAAWLVFAFGEGNGVQVYASVETGGPLCLNSQAYTLRDINADGRREVAVVRGCGDGPGGGSSLFVFGTGKGGFQGWGRAELTFGFAGDNQWSSRSSRLYVRKGKDFQIYAVRRLEEGFSEGPDGARKLRLQEEGTAVLRVNLLTPPWARDTLLVRLF